ncbi:MAG: hypothetical protein HY231_01285 [Acidobacteria bacterium]|nr:hypothetical protein [Acidobacteriota bacterium]
MNPHRIPYRPLLCMLALLTFTISIALFTTSTVNSASRIAAEVPPQAAGKIIAKVDFDPKTDGFGFRNYGGEHEGEEELTAEDLIRMFGADQVCMSGTTGEDCELYEPAQVWLESQIKGMEGGHCEGMAVTSFRFWLEKPFKNKKAPATFQQGAEAVFDLEKDSDVENYIAYYFVLQTLPEVYRSKLETLKKKPSVILKMLIDSMQDETPDYTLSIAKRINGQYTAGHTVTPFAVEDMGEGIYRVHIYDNNYPGVTKYVTFDVKRETWRYHTAANPNDVAKDYVGTATTETLSLKRLADRERKRYGCPFCEDLQGDGASADGSAGAPEKNDRIGISMDGEGELLITNPEGKRVGFDFAKDQYVNEVGDVEIVTIEGGVDEDVSPLYRFPYRQSAKPYSITVSGKTADHEVDADVEMEGPGFVVGFEGILLDPGENLTMTISPDGRQLSFTASQDGETPNLFISIESGHKKPSYLFEIGGIKLSPGKTVTVALDLEKGRLYFKDNDPDQDPYDVTVVRLNPDGTKNSYRHDDTKVGKGDVYMIDFGKWNGKGALCFKEDDDGNGFEDEDCVEEENEPTPAKKGN